MAGEVAAEGGQQQGNEGAEGGALSEEDEEFLDAEEVAWRRISPREVVGESMQVEAHGAELSAGRQPMLASGGRYEVTSRDRLFIQLARLPRHFHLEVGRLAAFPHPSTTSIAFAKICSKT